MRTDHVTSPIAPTVTDRYQRWPAVNDLDAPLPVPAHVPDDYAPVADYAPGSEPRRPVPDAFEHPPLPAVADHVVDHPDRRSVFGPGTATVAGTGEVAPLARRALRMAVISLPLILLFGLGGLTGLVAVAMGAVAIRQIRRRPGLRGNGRAIVAIVVGTSAAVVGLPVLLLLLLGVAGVIALL